ncbi:hypothetical protein [Ancylomarina longa]|uniref:Uncharacterized protein n=1 Tax=Ancylomarina longa TaxID=2487017 RepID=A0A434AUS0_9BACT|nr:hypothetical protein [Ancylomarina longa]RUT78218.1 hypothetical protein DLK05_09065 [Ancylomarina longa]
MLEELIKNTKNYFWDMNKDGDIILGCSDIEPKAKIIFTLTDNWVNLAPIVEEIPGSYVGHPHNYLKNTKEYKQVVKLMELVKSYLENEPTLDRDLTLKNTMKFIQKHYLK